MSDEFKVDPEDKRVTSLNFLKMLAPALGINYPVRRILLDVTCEGPQVVIVESVMRNEQGKRIAVLLTEKFELHKKSETQTPIG